MVHRCAVKGHDGVLYVDFEDEVVSIQRWKVQ